jgi:hypothetical protein
MKFTFAKFALVPSLFFHPMHAEETESPEAWPEAREIHSLV